LDHLN
jgi:hypothetical protein